MALRRSPNRHPGSSHPVRKHSPRRPPNSPRRDASQSHLANTNLANSHGLGASTEYTLRHVLIPLHPNLRRLPSRLLSGQKESMRDASRTQVGAKRKRVVSSNENAHPGGRPSRGSGRPKRPRASRMVYNTDGEETEDQNEEAAMDIDDASAPWQDTASSDSEEDDESCDEHLIKEAPPRQLLRMRKDFLVHLYATACLPDDAEFLTKQEIVDAIVAAREEVSEPPISSSPSRLVSSVNGSSDDGNVAGDEQTDFGVGIRAGLGALRRRATANDAMRTNHRASPNRSVSLGNIPPRTSTESRKRPRTLEQKGRSGSAGRRTATDECNRSDPSHSRAAATLPSPPATRTRSRKIFPNAAPPVRITCQIKTKHVEFAQGRQVNLRRRVLQKTKTDESDSTDVAELAGSPSTVSPSPRRLRSQGRRKSGTQVDDEQGAETGRRIIPPRKAKGRIGSLRESETEEDEREEEEGGEPEDEDEDEDADDDDDDDDEEEEEEEVEVGEDDEVDELVSTASATPPPLQGRQTPVKSRLRPRRMRRTSTTQDASDGDDEGEDEDAEGETVVTGEGDESVDEVESVESVDGDAEESVESVDGDAEESVEEPGVVEPRRLRNGKIVADDEVALEESIDCSEDDDEDEEESEANDVEDIDIESGSETGDREDSDEVMEDVDLTVATAKTLVRLRRDDLVKMCETRDLDIAGTKPQLAEALLQWRNRHLTEFSSPSSTGTVRPPSTSRARRHKSGGSTPPVLMRSNRFHTDEPRTPPLSENRKEHEPELELDLESLGLEDREIPPEQLTKLEKIGSGGFKDVFMGKFKGRKIAISEFRGQLTAMDIKELKLLGGFNHPNIVRFLGVSIPENTRDTPVVIVSELCVNGDLFDYVRNVPPPSLGKVLSIMLDVARGLEYLHLRKPSVIHRDCKSSNILITARGTAKIADFGLAKVKQSTRSMVRSLVGTVNWQAPELWHPHPKYSYKVDVFSCALVYWEMLQWHLPNKKFPWEGMNEHAIYDLVGARRQRPSLTGLRKQWCPEIVDLIERMWAHDPGDRPTMSEVVEALSR